MSALLKLLLVTFIFFLTANGSAIEENLHALDKRAGFYGGYGLTIAPLASCPSGLTDCGVINCCPPGTVCVDASGICCPDSNDCTETVIKNPSCADPSLVMFLGHIGTSTLQIVDCCPAGQIVDVEGYCAPPGGSGPVSAQNTVFTTASQGNTAWPTGAGAPTTAAGTTGSGATPSSQSSATATSKSGSAKHVEVGLLGAGIMAILSLFL